MIRTKSSSINISNLNANLMQFAQDMSNQFDGIVITSGNDSVHMIGSRHYIDKALDFGANSSNKAAYESFKSFVVGNESIKSDYGIEDIIDESTHIHIEMPLTDEEIKTSKNKQYLLIVGSVLIIGAFYLGFKKLKK